MPTLHRGEYFSVQHHLASAHVRVIRSEAPFESVAEAVKALGACRDAISGLSLMHHGILFDWRRSPISTDPNLHKALAEQIDDIAEPFERRAILLATSVGTMQAGRVGRTMGNQKMSVFDDEAAAVEFVTQR
jgi:hypothetical protein